jgi:hypothetical protein
MSVEDRYTGAPHGKLTKRSPEFGAPALSRLTRQLDLPFE